MGIDSFQEAIHPDPPANRGDSVWVKDWTSKEGWNQMVSKQTDYRISKHPGMDCMYR